MLKTRYHSFTPYVVTYKVTKSTVEATPINYNTDLNNNFELKNLSAFVNDRFEGHGYVFNESNIFYIEVEVSHIEKMTARLNVETVIGNSNYPTVNLTTVEETIANTKSSFCRLQ